MPFTPSIAALRTRRRVLRTCSPFEALEARQLRTVATGAAFERVPSYMLPTEDAPAVTSTTGGTTTSGGTTMSNLASGTFDIQIVAGTGLAGNQAALDAFNRAAAEWEARITDPVTIRIDADLSALGSTSIIGQTSSVQVQSSYSTIRNALVSDASDESDDSIVSSLPTSANFLLPAGDTYSGQLSSTKAAMKALGFTGLDTQFGASDASITFNSGFAFDYDNRDGVSGGQMDFQTVAAHEIGHALGFTSMVDTTDYYAQQATPVSVSATTLDLYRFEDNVAGRDPTTAADFSSFSRSLRPNVAAVTDDITAWNGAAAENAMSTGAYTGDGRQASHWKDGDLSGATLGILDPTLGYGQVWGISDADWRALDLIGYDVAQSAATPPPTNTAPVANDDAAATRNDAVLTGAAPGVLANDTDANGDVLSVTPVVAATTAKGATVTINTDGSYTYDPRNSATLKALAAGATTTDAIAYTVTDGQGGSATATLNVTVTGTQSATPVATGDGLKVQYFKDATLTTPVAAEAIDSDGVINENWGTAAPTAGAPADNFSARWRGRVVAPSTGDYTFYALADDNVRLWVNGQLVIRNWGSANTSEYRTASALHLTAGTAYDLQFDYRDLTGAADASLRWSATNNGASVFSKQVIPRAQLYSTPTPAVRSDPYLTDNNRKNDATRIGVNNGSSTVALTAEPAAPAAASKNHGRRAIDALTL